MSISNLGLQRPSLSLLSEASTVHILTRTENSAVTVSNGLSSYGVWSTVHELHGNHQTEGFLTLEADISVSCLPPGEMGRGL